MGLWTVEECRCPYMLNTSHWYIHRKAFSSTLSLDRVWYLLQKTINPLWQSCVLKLKKRQKTEQRPVTRYWKRWRNNLVIQSFFKPEMGKGNCRGKLVCLA